MEVTRLNFKEALPIISEAIKDSSFLAIDAEFSGLTARKRENALDTCEERYQKLINGVKDFTILQFGVCAFNWDDDQQHYIAKPFNFYTFPKPYNRQMPDMRFLCQSSSLNFLVEKGFDFNKWISLGVPFLLPPDEDRLRRIVGNSRDQVTPNGGSSTADMANLAEPLPIPPAFEKTIELIMKKVEKFIEDPDQKSLSLQPSSPLVRKLVYSSVNVAYKSGLHLESKENENDEKFIMISKCSEQEKKDLENEKMNREHDEIELAVGFAKVIRLLSQSGKIILGHNMLLDVLHMIRLFVCPLPSVLDGFKSLVRGVLPRLIDTKVMASTKPLQSHFPISHLEAVYKKSSEAPFVKPNVFLSEEFEDYSNSTKAHEAGFDAYMTGVAFIAMASFLQKQRDGETPCDVIDFEIIKPFLNKIFLFPRMEDIPYLNLDAKDLIPSREHVFYIKHPGDWQFSDIQKLFKDFGYIYITKIDGTSAFVSIAKRERATKVMKKLNKDDVPYRIMKYNEYRGVDADDTGGGDCGNDSLDGQCSFLDQSSSCTPYLDTPNKIPEPMSSEGFKDNTPNETPEPISSKRSKDNILSEVEDGELPDSPEPARKKLKSQHIWFDEPDEW